LVGPDPLEPATPGATTMELPEPEEPDPEVLPLPPPLPELPD